MINFFKALIDMLKDGELSYLDVMIHDEIIKRHIKEIKEVK